METSKTVAVDLRREDVPLNVNEVGQQSYYFAYGTYLDSTLLSERMPEAAVITTACAVNRSLRFLTATGEPRRGWCHLADGGDAWGTVAYGLVVLTGPVDSGRFAYNNARYLTVHGDDGITYDCWTYCLELPESPMRLPAEEWRHICAGMDEWQLPAPYRNEIEERYDAAPACLA